jgi:hypothetical protein
MTAQTILGIDPGAHGAIAVLDGDGGLLEVVDMPSTPEANGRTATNAPLLAAILARAHARIAFCEFVSFCVLKRKRDQNRPSRGHRACLRVELCPEYSVSRAACDRILV